jgi:hypothetical protein
MAEAAGKPRSPAQPRAKGAGTIKVLEDERELAVFTSREVTRIEVVCDHGRQRWILDGAQWHVEDIG